MTTSRQKLRWSLGIALALHAVALSTYVPRALLEVEKRVRDLLAASGGEPPPPPPQTQQQIIPVTLPAGNFELQYTLGSLKDPPKSKKPKFDELPKFQPQMLSELSVSGNLRDAADQAARAEAAMQRMISQAAAQQRVTEEFIADIVLADSSVVIAPAPAALSVNDQEQLAQTPVEPQAAPAARAPQKPRPRPGTPAPQPPPRRAETPPPPGPAEPAPAQLPQQPVLSHEVYAVPPPPETAAEPIAAEAPPAAEFIPGLLPAPDRGPGEFTNGSRVFFSKLTAHLFRANQIALANAVKAGSKLTVDVRFFVARDGRVIGAQVVRSTGDRGLDARAEQVVLDASPVPQLADDMPQSRLELSFPVDIYR